MLVFGTQMHIVTFLFVCVEIVILIYLIIYRLARPDDKMSFLDIILITLLLTYNITGGLLPDPNLPGSFFVQESRSEQGGQLPDNSIIRSASRAFRPRASPARAARRRDSHD